MGVVYEAFDSERNAHVALKTLRSLTPESVVRLKREFRALQEIRHPNMISLGELFCEGDRWFFTMEIVDGTDFVGYVRHGAPDARVRAGQGTMSTADFARTTAHDAMFGDAFASGPAMGTGDTRTIPMTRLDGGGFDEIRVRSALIQLLDALATLHAAGLVHRDVTPNNVRVSPHGRVVLLDFGLVTDAFRDSLSDDRRMLGTPAYMAPEQATSENVGPAADLYAVGAILYEALTGVAPFQGSAMAVLVDKQRSEPLPPSARTDHVPRDLDALCVALLRRSPEGRPTAIDAIRALGRDATKIASNASVAASDESPFIGREAELAVIREASAVVRMGAPVTVLVRGAPGMGRTRLLREAIRDVGVGSPELLALEARCDEREEVTFKAFDAVIDGLARFLSRLDEAELAETLPPDTDALVQTFPGFRRVPTLERSSVTPPASDPAVARARAFEAMRTLLARVARRRPVVIAIDDVERADPDSHALLIELVRPPHAPPVLLVATLRATGSDARTHAGVRMQDLLRELPEMIPGEMRLVLLERLAEADARALAAQLLARALPTKRALAGEVAAAGRGNPHHIEVVVQHMATSSMPNVPSIERALWARVDSLEPAGHAIATALAVASRPLSVEILETAARTSHDVTVRELTTMRSRRLVTCTGLRSNDAVELYDEVVDAAIAPRLDAAARVDMHRRIAEAMELVGSGDVEALADHWRAAGDRVRAATYATVAGDGAMQALAFERAARLFESALAASPVDRDALYVKLGDAQTGAGRYEKAAVAYERAARHVTGAARATYEWLAADGLIRAGRLERGTPRLRASLAALGITFDVAGFAALAIALVTTALLWQLRRRPVAREIDEALARQSDLLWSASLALADVAPVRARRFAARSELAARRAGDAMRAARAVSLLAGERARRARAPGAASGALAAIASLAATRPGDVAAWEAWAHAQVAFAEGRFAEARAAAEEAARHHASRSTSSRAELEATALALRATAWLGEMRRLARDAPRALRRARATTNAWAARRVCVGIVNLHWLAHGSTQRSDAIVAEVLAGAAADVDPSLRVDAALALASAALYRGDAAAALRALDATRNVAGDAAAVALVHEARGRTALARALDPDAETKHELGAALRASRAVERDGPRWMRPLATLLVAGVEHARGAPSASEGFELAAAELRAAGLEGHARAAARAAAQIRADAEELRRVDAEMVAQGVADFARFCTVFTPSARGIRRV